MRANKDPAGRQYRVGEPSWRRCAVASHGTDTRHKGQEVMTTRKILDHRRGDNAQRVSSGRTRLRMLLALPAAAAAVAALAACSSSGTPSGASSSGASGGHVATNAKGFTLYSFAPTPRRHRNATALPRSRA